ncbi:MAG: GNAT family N-acetyltransferase [Lentimicrobium sp.]|nr:GNAT family N-acetyltransferase [Lentimicrobium sp.]
MIPNIVSFSIDQADYTEVSRRIRYTVFVEEQKVPEDLEYDEFESDCRHYLMFIGDTEVATCRWRFTSKGIKLERFAVLSQYRGKGLGDLLVKHVLGEVLPVGKTVYLHAQEKVTGFYEKLGFKAYGEIFEEAGIWHYLMKFEG